MADTLREKKKRERVGEKEMKGARERDRERVRSRGTRSERELRPVFTEKKIFKPYQRFMYKRFNLRERKKAETGRQTKKDRETETKRQRRRGGMGVWGKAM